MAEDILPERATFAEMKAFIASGVNAAGKPIDVKTFNKRGRKKLRDLYIEFKGRDIKLVRREDGRIVRYAWNIKVSIETPTRKLREVKREYVGDKEPLFSNEEFAISETQKRNEAPRPAATRGILEEMGIVVDEGELELLHDPLPEPGTTDKDPTRTSRVYADLLSLNITTRYMWRTSDAYWESNERLRDISLHGLVIPDHNVLIHLQWFNKKPSPPNGDSFYKRAVEISKGAKARVTYADIGNFLRGGPQKTSSTGPHRAPSFYTYA